MLLRIASIIDRREGCSTVLDRCGLVRVWVVGVSVGVWDWDRDRYWGVPFVYTHHDSVTTVTSMSSSSLYCYLTSSDSLILSIR